MPDPQESPAPSAAPPAKAKSRLAVVLVAVAVVALGAGAVYFWLQPDRPAKAAEGTAGAGATLTLETFIVNLSGSGERAYLRVGITLGLSRPLPRNKEEIPMALIRDTILSVLSTARADQLLGAEGKQQLKSALLQALRDRAPQLGIEDVYFTEFLVQM